MIAETNLDTLNLTAMAPIHNVGAATVPSPAPMQNAVDMDSNTQRQYWVDPPIHTLNLKYWTEEFWLPILDLN